VIPVKWLYKLRAFIDRRVPRDVLVIEFWKGDECIGQSDHMTLLLALAMANRVPMTIEHGGFRLTLRTEHLQS
jgi:hypothetical protein